MTFYRITAQVLHGKTDRENERLRVQQALARAIADADIDGTLKISLDRRGRDGVVGLAEHDAFTDAVKALHIEMMELARLSDTIYFVSEYSKDRIVCGAVSRRGIYANDIPHFPWHKLPIEVTGETCEEMTLAEFVTMTYYVPDLECYRHLREDVEDAFLGAHILSVPDSTELQCRERIAVRADEKDSLFLAQRINWRDSLGAELGRIYSDVPRYVFEPHPVHYLISTDSAESGQKACDILVNALYERGRLAGRRYFVVDVSRAGAYSAQSLDAVYRLSEGCAVVLTYRCDRSEDGCEDAAYVMAMELIKKYSDVLTVLCFPRGCEEEKKQFRPCFDDMFFLELKGDKLAYPEAQQWLLDSAHYSGICDSDALWKVPDKSYTADELEKLYKKGYSKYLRTVLYPQYAKVKRV